MAILSRFLKKKMKTCYYKVTVQTLYGKPVEEKRDDNFLCIVLPPFLNIGATFAFFHSGRNLPELKQFWKIISSGLHMEKPQSFIMRMLIMSWPWALIGSRFFIILYISFFGKIMVSKMLLVSLKHVLGKVLIFFNKVHCSEK